MLIQRFSSERLKSQTNLRVPEPEGAVLDTNTYRCLVVRLLSHGWSVPLQGWMSMGEVTAVLVLTALFRRDVTAG